MIRPGQLKTLTFLHDKQLRMEVHYLPLSFLRDHDLDAVFNLYSCILLISICLVRRPRRLGVLVLFLSALLCAAITVTEGLGGLNLALPEGLGYQNHMACVVFRSLGNRRQREPPDSVSISDLI